jgi:hypothetical protein
LTETVASVGLLPLERIDIVPEAVLVTEAPPARVTEAPPARATEAPPAKESLPAAGSPAEEASA